ncbi:HEPN domain-containing protein [uncultured Methanoregula sp.]|uniref:HEPN domain-containing protein n=1 Tax=uncultured Methanoregula sp. TaxID=1005933 RepID=UPI002AAB9C1F|nr:HEPN domain-containing protein [uncultured Methanoregula sp.]
MIEDLEREGLIKKLPYDRKKVEDALAHAHRDLKTAGTIIPTDQDWAYTIAYNAVLQAGRALMFSKGYRPDGANQHISVVKFADLFLDKEDAIIFDRMRRKRHSSVYDTAGSISETEARSAMTHAGVLLRKIEDLIEKIP